MSWSAIVVNAWRDTMNTRFTRHHHAALDRTLIDRTRLASALYELVTAVQVGEPVALKDAEAAAIDVLVSVGGRPQEALQEEA